MDTRSIGTLEVSVVGIGCNNFGSRLDADAVEAVVTAALEHGVNFFDTADIYGAGTSEELLGKAVRDRRDEVVIATKFGGEMGEGRTAKPEYVHRAVDASLSRLVTDRIDLYQLHFPDPDTPVAETLGALDELVVAGKVREIGCSNFNAEMLREAAGAVGEGRASFSCLQNHLSLMQRGDESDGLAECDALGLAYLPYFPLANGLLTGKYSRGEPPPEGTRITANPARASQLLTDATFDQLERLAGFAAGRGHSLLDLAFAWLLAHPAVASVIAGATKPEQVAANAGAAAWQLSEEDVAELSELLSY
jgi:aryl-alcohol dehydrogenase-like predicted oxidoreductase